MVQGLDEFLGHVAIGQAYIMALWRLANEARLDLRNAIE
jgi:hypothetical protein